MKNNSQLLMPREKMLKFGISALTDVELLALFLRTGTRGKGINPGKRDAGEFRLSLWLVNL